MAQNIQHPETQKIILTYKVIYKIFFVFGNFTLAILLSVGGLYLINTQFSETIAANSSMPSIQSPHTAESNAKIPELDNDFTLYAFQNTDIWQDDTTLSSDRNILTYKGYTLPAHVSSLPTSLASADVFENPQYPLSSLKNSIKTILFTSANNTKSPFEHLPPLGAQGTHPNNNTKENRPNNAGTSIEEVFDLKCLYSKRKLTDTVCREYISDTVSSLTQYDLRNRHQELASLINYLPTSLHQTLCKNITTYIRRTGDTSKTLETLMQTICREDQFAEYQKTQSLIRANNDLTNQKSADAVGENQIINEYILHSLLQDIYNDITNGNINPLTLKQYIQIWNKILKEKKKVSDFTYNASYYINNTLIAPGLNNKNLTSRIDSKELSTLQKQIRQINDGSSSNHGGIKNFITNTSLISNQELGQTDAITSPNDSTKNLQGKYYQEISRQEGNPIVSIGELITAESEANIPLTIYLTDSQNIQSIKLTSSAERENIINSLIKQGQLSSLFAIESFIISNRDNITADKIEVCDVLATELQSSLTLCNENQITIQQTMNETPVRYDININDQKKITKFKINNSHMQQRIREDVSTFDTNASTLIPTIIAIAQVPREPLKKPNPLHEQSGQSDKLLVIDHIKKYMGIEPQNVGQRGTEFVIGLEIQEQVFYAAYQVENHTITKLILPNITINNKRVILEEFSLPLDNNHSHDIKQFIDDPIAYIKKRYPSVNTIYKNAD